MYILGIESSCDETSAAVVEADDSSRRIAADIVASQIDIHRLYGGVVPEIAGAPTSRRSRASRMRRWMKRRSRSAMSGWWRSPRIRG